MSTSSGQSLEKLIERIHSVLDRDAAVVWNNKVRDPDTGRLRQIDVTIKRADSITYVECRDHRNPQDIKWIEELIGRKESLKADAIIGVSKSGFTKPALIKAKSHGIHLRDLQHLSDEDIKNWGYPVRVYATYIEFKNIVLCSTLAQAVEIKTAPLELGHTSIPEGKFLILLFQMIVEKLPEKMPLDVWHTIDCIIDFPGTLIGKQSADRFHFTSKVRTVQKEFAIASLHSYGAPDEIDDTRDALIDQRTELKTEIITSKDNARIVFDISSIDMPKNHFLKHWTVDLGRNSRAKIETIGSLGKMIASFDIEVSGTPIKAASSPD